MNSLHIRSNNAALVILAMLNGCVQGANELTDAGNVYVPLPDGGTFTCRGNSDSVIDRAELQFLPGVEARYRINPAGVGVTVNVQGTMTGALKVWDFSNMDGPLQSVRLDPLAMQWFAPMFAGAQYTARIDPRTPTLGIYRATDSALELFGAAGEAAASRTILKYDTPVPLLRFPLALNNHWTAVATVVDGMVDGTTVASRDEYDITVDAHGEVRLGILTFRDALRVRIETVQRFPVGPARRSIQYLWLAECYGEVARVTSRDGEVDPNFTIAAEFRRLGL